MKNLIKFILVLFIPVLAVQAQILEPVKWMSSVEKISATEYDLIATANIDKGWHLYSQNVPDGGPNPTSFVFENSEGIEFIGKTTEQKGQTIQDVVFEMKIKYFENKAEFRQRVKVIRGKLLKVNAEVEFMACNDKQCTAPTYVDLIFNLPN